jgi:hypothetical protein
MISQMIDSAFNELRGIGYFAERHFQCCNTCAWAAIDEAQADKAVFIHEQNEERLLDGMPAYIGWSGDGDEIVKVLKGHGLAVEWDGSEDTTIQVS